MRKPMIVILALSIASGLAVADVTYEEETKMGGLMNVMMLGRGMKTSTRVSGNFLRTDSGSDATIIDLEGERILTLDTKKKTYSVMTFAEMAKQMESTMAMVKGKKAEGQSGSSDVALDAEARVTETGRSETILGVECKQYLLELDLKASSEKEQQSGTMSTVTEMWLAKSVPGGEELYAFYRRMAAKLGTTSVARPWASGGDAQSMQMSASMQKVADEMKKMDGHAMRSILYFGDPEAAKAEARGEKMSGGGKGGLGGLGGMLKKMKPVGNEEPSEGSDEAPGGVMMKMTTETKKIDTKPIDPKVFAVPGDYKLVTPESL